MKAIDELAIFVGRSDPYLNTQEVTILMQKHFGGCKPEEALVSPKSAKSASEDEKKPSPHILENFSRFMKTRANEIETLKALVCGIINDVSLLQLNGQEID